MVPSTVNGIEFRQVSKRYGPASAPLVVKGIDFVVAKGSLTTLLGPSGCGKTTTLRMIAGLETASGGQILIDGKDVTQFELSAEYEVPPPGVVVTAPLVVPVR